MILSFVFFINSNIFYIQKAAKENYGLDHRVLYGFSTHDNGALTAFGFLLSNFSPETSLLLYSIMLNFYYNFQTRGIKK